MIEVREISSTTQLDSVNLFVAFITASANMFMPTIKKEAEDKVRAAIEKKEK